MEPSFQNCRLLLCISKIRDGVVRASWHTRAVCATDASDWKRLSQQLSKPYVGRYDNIYNTLYTKSAHYSTVATFFSV